MAPPRGEVLQGTLDLIVLKTIEALDRCTATASHSVSSRSRKICSISTRARSIRHCCAWNSGDGSPPNGVHRRTTAKPSTTL